MGIIAFSAIPKGSTDQDSNFVAMHFFLILFEGSCMDRRTKVCGLEKRRKLK